VDVTPGAPQGSVLGPFMLFYFLFYTDGDLRTFTLLFYVVLFLVVNRTVDGTVICKKTGGRLHVVCDVIYVDQKKDGAKYTTLRHYDCIRFRQSL
jgi:hypothetical protein